MCKASNLTDMVIMVLFLIVHLMNCFLFILFTFSSPTQPFCLFHLIFFSLRYCSFHFNFYLVWLQVNSENEREG